jgi:predicted acylesterase/phospholipase RssA
MTMLRAKDSIYHIRFVKAPGTHLRAAHKSFRLYPGLNNSFYVTAASLYTLKVFSVPFEVIRDIAPEDTDIKITIPTESMLHDPPEQRACDEIIAFAISRSHHTKSCYPLYMGRTSEPKSDTFVHDIASGTRRYRWRWCTKAQLRRVKTAKSTFLALSKRIEDPDTRFVISLGSGGLRMFAHPSIFKFIESLELRESVDEIWGCSGGAIMSLAYSLGADSASMEGEGYSLYQKKYNMRVNPRVSDILKNFAINSLFPNASLDLRGFIDIRNTMEQSLERVARHRRIQIPMYAIAYNMNTKQNEVLTPCRSLAKHYKGHIKFCSAMNSILASSAIPVLHVPRVVKHGKSATTYIDGSLFEEVPLSSIYNKWHIDKDNRLTKKKKLFLLAINLFPHLSTLRALRRFPFNRVKVLKFFSTMLRLTDRSRMLRLEQQARIINADPDAHVVMLNLHTLSRHHCLDPKIIPVSIDRAHSTFATQLIEIERKLQKQRRKYGDPF